MIRSVAPLVLAAGSIACVATARAKTWTVDALQRPGADFADLVSAVGAASAGDLLFVRAATYTKAPSIDKPLRVLGEKGAVLDLTRSLLAPARQLVVTGIAAGRQVRIQGLTILVDYRSYRAPSSVVVRDNRGTVHLQDVVIRESQLVRDPGTYALHVTNSPTTLKDVEVGGTARVEGSSVLFERCKLVGRLEAAQPWRAAMPALEAKDAVVKLVATSCVAQRQTTYNPGPAVYASGSGLEVHRGCQFVSMGVAHWFESDLARPSVLHADSTLQLPPSVAVGFLEVAHRPLAMLQSDDAILGGKLKLQLDGRANALFILFLGAPQAPVYYSGLGELWLELPSLLPLHGGQLSSFGHWSTSIPVPNELRLAGHAFGWQALEGPLHALELSNPSVSIVHPAPGK